MLDILIAIPVILVAGYFIATNHHRFREWGAGVSLGTSVNGVVTAGDDDDDDDLKPDSSDGRGGQWTGDADSTSSHDDGSY